MHCKRRGSEKSTFLAIFWGFWFSQDRLPSRTSIRKPLNLIKSPIFTNTPCKRTCLYNAPSMHTVEFMLKKFMCFFSEDGKGWGHKRGDLKTPWFSNQGFFRYFQAFFRHFSCVFRGSGAMKNAWKFLYSKIRAFSEIFQVEKGIFKSPPFVPPPFAILHVLFLSLILGPLLCPVPLYLAAMGWWSPWAAISRAAVLALSASPRVAAHCPAPIAAKYTPKNAVVTSRKSLLILRGNRRNPKGDGRKGTGQKMS